MLDVAFRRSSGGIAPALRGGATAVLVLMCIAAAACGDDSVGRDGDGDDDDGDSGPGGHNDGGGVAGASGRFDLDAGFTDGGDTGGEDDDAGGSAGSGGEDEDAGGGGTEVSCSGDADCDDQDLCTEDRCVRTVCLSAVIDPDDADACTTDSCDPDTGVHNDPIDPDDADACTTDSCDPATGVANAALDINDSNACTTDSCDASSGAVDHAPVWTDDGNGCTTDSCDPATGVAHTPVAVDDSDGCTTDSCTAPAGTIAHTFCSSGLCDTSQVCFDVVTTPFNDTPGILISASGPTVVSDTIQVSGLASRIWDVNVRTSITHTFSADLSITVRSPAGTVVTLSSNNGAGNDVFNGTVWDDGANPGGLAPYSSNGGLATDHPYTASVTATPLAPEEALGAFIGEDPNGIWTLTVSDDLADDGGNLAGWGLDIRTISAAPAVQNQTFTQGTAAAIPDANGSSGVPGIVTSNLVVPANAAGSRVCSLTVTTNITHAYAADLDITLTAPSGKIVTLTSDNGGANANVFAGTVWDDNANPLGQVPYGTNNGLATDHLYANLTLASPLVPEEALSALVGETVAGTWTLTISDDGVDDIGTLNSWSLNIGRCMR